MTAIRDRSMNAEMLEGSVDGTYKRIRPNWAGPRAQTADDRRMEREDRLDLNRGANGYGLYEADEKRTPDGRFVRDQGAERLMLSP